MKDGDKVCLGRAKRCSTGDLSLSMKVMRSQELQYAKHLSSPVLKSTSLSSLSSAVGNTSRCLQDTSVSVTQCIPVSIHRNILYPTGVGDNDYV